MEDCIGCEFGLEDRRHRLYPHPELVARPVELRRVEGAELHHRQPDGGILADKFRAQRIGEAADGSLGAAIRRLQWDRAVGEGGSYLHDRPTVPPAHASQRSQRAVHGAEVGDLRDLAEFIGGRIDHRREHRGGGVVDPDLDRAEFALDAVGRFLYLSGIGNVGDYPECLGTHLP
jgi:hypothetical protein